MDAIKEASSRLLELKNINGKLQRKKQEELIETYKHNL